ncbi:hypothetical protein [Saliphagus infecundisoli]|uniref:Uncharacterized protein n=1 Tax=Saliphagus infecundisoli TaxID=1849069 RepID=A0ABD5QBK0_9EURY|nr:hypothetical protein [Saliphagus infecundisoli]
MSVAESIETPVEVIAENIGGIDSVTGFQVLQGCAGIETSCQLVLGLNPCVEPLDDLGLVLRTRHRDDRPILHLYQGMRRIVRGETATGTRHSASRSMRQEIGCVFGR